MRLLKEEEEAKVLKKLENLLGDQIKDLLENKKLYFNNKKVLLVTDEQVKAVSQFSRDKIISVGVIIGKFTKNDNFRITISSLSTLQKYGLYKVWIKPSAEMNFLYGNNALKSHILRISENIPRNAGVFVYNQYDTPLGFGLMAVNNNSYNRARTGDIVVLTQADNGEYIRNEANIA